MTNTTLSELVAKAESAGFRAWRNPRDEKDIRFYEPGGGRGYAYIDMTGRVQVMKAGCRGGFRAKLAQAVGL